MSGEGREEIAGQTFAVAPDPVLRGPGTASAITLHALHRDAGQPAAALANRGAEAARTYSRVARGPPPSKRSGRKGAGSPAGGAAGRFRNLR